MMQIKHDGWAALLSVLNKALDEQYIEREEVRDSLNYLLDKSPGGPRLSGIGPLIQLIQDPAVLFCIPTLAMVLGTNMTSEVLCGMYDSMRDHGLFKEDNSPYSVPGAVACTGTGGKQVKTINVSTASAIIAASAGGKIVRSGTHSFFSSSGASDLLEFLNMPRITDLSLVESIIDKTGLAFIEGEAFSPLSRYGKSSTKTHSRMLDLVKLLVKPLKLSVSLMKPMRCEYAHRGIILPATHAVAEALRCYRGVKRGLVVFGRDARGNGFDELCNVGRNEVSVFDTCGTDTYTLWPSDVGLPLRKTEEIEIKCKEQGYTIVTEVLKGKRVIGDPFAELLALNAAGILYAGNFVASIKDGVEKAMTAIETGMSYHLVEQYRSEFRYLKRRKK